jgi:hypothetical protein
MAANRKILDLRNLLAERFHPTNSSRANTQLITGLDVFDENGGLIKGAITELTSAQTSAGSALLIHCLLRVALRERFFLALVDGRDSFDVQSTDSAALAHLFWVRCETAAQAVKSADLLLRDGNFPLVILDFECSRGIAADSSDQLVPFATPGRSIAHGIFGDEPVQSRAERERQTRVGKSMAAWGFAE